MISDIRFRISERLNLQNTLKSKVLPESDITNPK